MPHKPVWHQRLAAALIYAVARVVSATIRYEWKDETGSLISANSAPIIFCLWHNRLALAMEIKRLYFHPQGRKRPMAAMVSASKDGGLLASILKYYGLEAVRGSSSRRGRQAMLELTTWAEQGYDISITPDGPRGPCYVVQDGAIAISQLTGFPIVPVTYHLSRKIQVKSWDRFQIPLPFAKCVMHFGPPLPVPRELSDEERERLRHELERRLRAATVD